MQYVFWWLLLAVPCFFVAYCNGAHMNLRIKSANSKYGFWKFHKNLFHEGFRLLVHDYFEVYCPWSWKVAKNHRLADMRAYLCTYGCCHDQLGYISAADCDDPEKQEAIAYHTYMSRTRYWTQGIFHFFIAPVPGCLIIISTAIAGIIIGLGLKKADKRA